MSITLSATRAPAARLAAFSAIMLPVTAAQVPIGVYLPALYAQHFGVPLGLLGAIFPGERVWGTAADPIIGWLSDRTRSRFGRRKSWIAAGSVVYAGATILLFFPVLKVTALYLACSLFVFYLSWSMMQIPYLAWSGELSGDYHERTRIATAQSISAALSLMLVLALPVLVDQIRSSDAGLKLGAMGGLIVFFVASYVGLPRWASGLYLLQFVFGIVAAPIWAAVAGVYGKHRTAVAAELFQAAVNLALLSVVPGRIGLLLALTIAQGLAQGSGNLMLRSMVADVVDRHRLATGVDRGRCFSRCSVFRRKPEWR